MTHHSSAQIGVGAYIKDKRTPSAPPMAVLDFDDHYIIYVAVIMCVLCCCQGIMQSFGSFVQGVDRCVEATCSSCCDLPECCGQQDASMCALLLRRVLLLFCFAQPPLLYSVRFLSQSEHLKLHNEVWLLQLERSGVQLESALGNMTLPEPLPSVQLGVLEIDYMLLAVAFGLTNSCNVLFFTTWSNTLNGATPWDCAMSESKTWFNYELSYYVQVLFMNWMLLALACRGQTVQQVYFAGITMALVVWFFLAASRFTHDTSLEHYCATVAFTVLLLTMLPLWESMSSTCPVSLAAAAMLLANTCALVLGHYTAFGQASAAYICLLRFAVTVLCGVFNMVVLALDDGLCARGSV